jgi:hypothetical protein
VKFLYDAHLTLGWEINMKKTITLLATALFSIHAFGGLDLPPAPKGYKWNKILKDQSALLQPEGWFFKEIHPKGTDAYFVTKQNIDKEGSFSTGLSLNVLYNIDKKAKVSPSQYAIATIQQMQSSTTDEVLLADAKQMGPFKNFICRIKDKKPNAETVIIHYFYVANDETGTLWMFFFEAPEKEWDKAWETGSVLLKNLLIESEI